MATGGDVPGKTNYSDKDSTEKVDFLCFVCTKKNQNTEAVKYCVTCEEYFCAKCVEQHEYLPVLSGHVVVAKGDFKGKEGRDELPSIPTERCVDHPAKIVDMYCETHDQVGCSICMTLKHEGSCKRLYIPENIDKLFDIEKISRTENELCSAIQRVEEALDLRDRCLENLLKLADDASQQLDKYTDDVIKKVKEFKQNTQDELDSTQKEIKTVFFDQKSVMKKELDAARNVLKQTQRSKLESNNKAQQITSSVLAASAMQKCNDVCRNLNCPDVKEISFQPHVVAGELFEGLKTYTSLGQFVLRDSRGQCHSRLYKVERKETKTMEIYNDRGECNIHGACALYDGTILFADYDHQCLKRMLQNDINIAESLKLPGNPWAVAVINQKEVAVTRPYYEEVYIIELEKTMKLKNTLTLNFRCFGIATCNNKLLISSRSTVYVYSVEGRFLRKFSFIGIKVPITFSEINAVAVSENGQLLFLVDKKTGLFAFEVESQRQLWSYSENDLKSATGVCLDGRGGVFVCGYDSHNVLQFSESGEKIGVVVTQEDGIKCPLSICFVSNRPTLAVMQNSVAQMFRLKSTKLV